MAADKDAGMEQSSSSSREQSDDSDATPDTPSSSNTANNSNNATHALGAFHDVQTILAAYDRDRDRKLSADELRVALQDYQEAQNSSSNDNNDSSTEKKHNTTSAATRALARYDQNDDGQIDAGEIKVLYTDLDTSETILKYLAFTGSLSTMGKIVRALHAADAKKGKPSTAAAGATTSSRTSSSMTSQAALQGRQFWQGMRGGLVQWSWRITYGYVITDTLWEGYTHSLDGDYQQGARHMASRASFNVTMVYTSMYTVKYTIELTSKLLPSYLKVGPRWLVPCLLSTTAVLNIPSLVAKPIKQGLGAMFGATKKSK